MSESPLTRISAAVLAYDRVLTEVAGRIRLFFHINPRNQDQARKEFLARPGRSREPKFEYPPMAFSPKEQVQSLARVGPNEDGDARFWRLLRERALELERLVALIASRGSQEFKVVSRQLFGSPPESLLQIARELLELPHDPEIKDQDAGTLEHLLRQHLLEYRKQNGEFPCEVSLEPHMSSNMYVHENRVFIKQSAKVSFAAAQCDKHHEIDAHLLTYANGVRQPLGLFRTGLKNSHVFQESLGIFTEIASGVFYAGRMISLASRVVAVGAMDRGDSFTDVFEMLVDAHGIEPEDAYTVCQRVFRGGGFTKDWVYLAKLWDIFDYWASGGDMSLLLLGKVTLEEVETLRGLLEQDLLVPPGHLPPYLGRIHELRKSEAVRTLRSGPPDLQALMQLPW